jgi:hypothetical protein
VPCDHGARTESSRITAVTVTCRAPPFTETDGLYGSPLLKKYSKLHWIGYFRRREAKRRERARRRACFDIISARMVAGWRLARRREIVSRPPLKTRSTETADPRQHVRSSQPRQLRPRLTRNRENVARHPRKTWELRSPTCPPLDRVRRRCVVVRIQGKERVELVLRSRDHLPAAGEHREELVTFC